MNSESMADPKSISPTTVLHIAPTPFFADRGCHIRIRNELAALKKQPYKVVLCTYHHGNDVPGIDIRRIPTIPGYTKLDAGYSPFRFIADFLLLFLVLKVAWQERPSVLHAHLHEGVMIGWLVKLLLFWRGMTLFMDMQGSLSGELAAYGTFQKAPWMLRFIRWIEWLICRMPDYIFCSSTACRETLVHDFGVALAKSELLVDVVPDDFFQKIGKSRARSNFGIPPDKKVVIYTGSLLPGKGIDHVLNSMTLLAQERRDLYWILVGYPVEDVADFLEKHSLTDAVCKLVGRVAYSELASWLATADIALEPKESESSEASGKVLHYMAAGLPVVCFSTDNNFQLLGDNGYYADAGDVRSFADGILRAVEDGKDAEVKGNLARQHVAATYSLAAVEKQLSLAYGQRY